MLAERPDFSVRGAVHVWAHLRFCEHKPDFWGGCAMFCVAQSAVHVTSARDRL